MPHYKFEFSRQAEKTFITLEKILQKRIFQKLQFWEGQEDPLSFSKQLKGKENTFRFRIGDYRIFVRPNDAEKIVILVIVKVGHRSAVYQ